MNTANLSIAGCGSFGFLVFFVMFLLVVSTIQRFPRDLIELSNHYRNQNWSEFRISAGIAGLFWSGSLFCLLFFYAAYTLPKGEYG